MPTFKSASTAQLLAEIARREKGATKIQARRDKLAKQVAKLDAELAAFGVVSTDAPRRGRPPGSKNKVKGAAKSVAKSAGTGTGKRAGKGTGKRRRASNEMTLPDALAAAVPAGQTVSPLDATAAVEKAGYKTYGKAFNQQVAAALAKDKRFKKLGRGQYQRVGGASAGAGGKKPAKTTRKTTSKKATQSRRKTSRKSTGKKSTARKTGQAGAKSAMAAQGAGAPV